MPLKASEALHLPIEEQVALLAETLDSLNAAYEFLGQSRVQERSSYFRGYRASTETSHAARDVAGQREAEVFIEEIFTTEAQIQSLTAYRDFLIFIINA